MSCGLGLERHLLGAFGPLLLTATATTPTATMLVQLPPELLHQVFCYLPQNDLLSLLRTCKISSAIAVEFIDSARCREAHHCDSLYALLASESGRRIVERIRRLDLTKLDADVVTEEMPLVLECAGNVVHLGIDGHVYAEPRMGKAVRSMRNLKSLQIVVADEILEQCPLPEDLEELHLSTYFRLDISTSILLALSKLAHLHTLTLHAGSVRRTDLPGIPPMPSVRNLTVGLNRRIFFDFSTMLPAFPCLTTLSFPNPMCIYIGANIFSLHHLRVPLSSNRYEEGGRYSRLRLGWLELTGQDDDSDAIPCLRNVATYCCEEYPLGLSVVSPELLREQYWQDIVAIAPSLRWLDGEAFYRADGAFVDSLARSLFC